MLIPFRSFDEKERLSGKLKNDKAYLDAGKDYLDAAFDQPSYVRIESIFLRAFPDMPVLQLPALSSPRNERIYELRSYEGPTEKLSENKVKMFNDGGEVRLFKQLGFNAIFYAETIVGSRMPNLMYMTSFENKSSHDEHWKAFGEAPEWKKISAMSEYQHNVSKSDIFLLYPTEYSDI